MRVAGVGFMNAWPLVLGLPWPVAPLLPAAMTPERLRAYDLVLAPVMATLGDPDWALLPTAPAIGCRGAVQSVRLDCAPGHDVASIRRVGLSPESQTSNALVQVLLAAYWQRPVGTVKFGIALPDADAEVIIGDRALQTTPPAHSIDLGAAWFDWTGLPFVFAAWFHRTDRPLAPDIAAHLCAARDHNLAHLDALLSTQGLAPEAYRAYFRERLHYAFGPAEHAGLARFFSEVKRYGVHPVHGAAHTVDSAAR